VSDAIPDNIGVRCGNLPQRGDGLLGARLLHVAHDGIEKHNGEDGDGFVGQGRVALIQPQPCGN
jgi:hypothetical protein